MFEDYLKESTKKWEENAKKLLLEFSKDFDDFKNRLLNDLSRRKIELETHILKLEKDKEEHERASQEMIKLSDGIKNAKETIGKYEAKQKEMFNKITEIEAREQKCIEKEGRLNQKEKNLEKQEEQNKIEVKMIEERQRDIKKYWANTHPIN